MTADGLGAGVCRTWSTGFGKNGWLSGTFLLSGPEGNTGCETSVDRCASAMAALSLGSVAEPENLTLAALRLLSF